jgi:CubicO group peptidase (beta-lactamase class C family)
VIKTALLALTVSLVGAPALAQSPAQDFAAGLADYRREHQIPSFSVIVLQDGEPVVEEYLGWSDDEGDVETTAQTSYFIASVSKAVTGTALFLADRAGTLDLDTPLNEAEDWRDFCDWFPGSGIIFAGGQDGDVTVPPFTCQGQTLRQAVNMRVNGEPGTTYLYNPLVFSRLGRFIDEVHPLSLRDLVYAYTLDPARMEHTAAGWRDHERGHVLSYLAPPFDTVEGRLEKQPLPDDDFRGAAGLYMSPGELARFDRALHDGTLIDDEAREALWTAPLNADGMPSAYAHGWHLQDYRGERLVYHSGWQPDAYSAIYLKVPERGLTLIAMANTEALWWGNRLDRSEIHMSDLVSAFFDSFGIGE